MTARFKVEQKGATLLEVMLAIGVAGVIFILGIKMYQSYQNTAQLEQLRYNVDQLFQAMGNYYKANCAAGDISPNPPDILSPYPPSTTGIPYPPTPTSYFPVPITSKLINDGYLTNWAPSNPMIDKTGGESGYVVQLNPIILSGVAANACVVLNSGTHCVQTTPTSTIPATQALIVTWAIQIAVKIKQLNKIGAYANLLGADCISGETSGSFPTTIDACPSVNPNRNYIVWKRIPSAATLKKGSVLDTSLPALKQFNLQYTHDQNYELGSGYSSTSPAQAPVYYLCGG